MANITVNIDSGVKEYTIQNVTDSIVDTYKSSGTHTVEDNKDYVVSATLKYGYKSNDDLSYEFNDLTSDKTIDFTSYFSNQIIDFVSKEVYKDHEDTFHLQWSCKFPEGMTDDENIGFLISRSYDSKSGFHNIKSNSIPIFIPINSGTKDSSDPDLYHYSFGDSFIKYNTNRTRYYKIKFYNNNFDEELYKSKSFFIKDDYDGVLDSIRHIEDLMYEFYSGTKFYLLKVNKTGERCPDCWDSYQHVQKYHNCKTCNGTGFKYPVYEAHNIFINKDSEPNEVKLHAVGEKTQDIIKCRTSNKILLDNRDILIEQQTGIRYQITGSIQRTKMPVPASYDNKQTKSDYTVSQLFSIKELDKDHEFYNIDIDNIVLPNEE